MRHLLVLCALACVGAAAPASAASYAFSFDNNGQGAVGVVIRGLSFDGTGPATSVAVTVNDGLGGVGVGEYLSVSSAATNTFTVSGGTILNADFKVLGGNNTEPAIVCCSLTFGFDGANNTFFAGLSNDPLSVTANPLDEIVFIPVPDIGEPSPVPVPAALPLLASGAAALAFAARRRRSR